MTGQAITFQSTGYGLIICLMLVAGFLGGLTNFFRNQEEGNKYRICFKNILMGICASLLIPLFLNMISSDLLKENLNGNLRFFVFFGFCLIASLSSKAFIETVSARLLNEIKKTQEKVDGIQRNVEPIVSKATESHEEGTPDLKISLRAFSFEDYVKKVMHSFSNTEYAWRTIKGIEKETSLPPEMVLKALNFLCSNLLAVKIDGNNRILWGLTLEGRDILVGMSPLKASD